MKTIMLTGVAGFIGSNLAQKCVELGYDVYGVDDLSNGHMEFVPKGVKFRRSDFASDLILRDIKSGRFDTVFHLAAVPRVSYSVEFPVETNDTNVQKTLALMDACRGKVRRLVFASSSSVYGGAELLPTSETHPKDPKSPYAAQKSYIEDMLKLFYDLYGLDSVCLRFFNVYGKNQLGDSPYSTAISAWLSAIKKGVPMRSDGDGTQSRDMCHVDNVVSACIKAGEYTGKLKAERFNVACGDRTTNNEIMAYLKSKYPKATHYDAPWRAGDVMHTHADISKAKNVLGYEPLVRIFEGIDKTIDWVENTPYFTRLILKK